VAIGGLGGLQVLDTAFDRFRDLLVGGWYVGVGVANGERGGSEQNGHKGASYVHFAASWS
jgi:hypothetical protein